MKPVDPEKGYQVFTLGCRTNRFESDALAQALEDLGFGESGEQTAVVVVNTCTVTHRADQQSRQLIRKCVRENPDAKLIVTGCLARLEAESLAKIKGVGLVLDPSEQGRLKEILTQNQAPEQDRKAENTFRDFGALSGTLKLGGRTRALLKVQDGCDNYCSYCRVRLARGRSRSLSLERALQGARELIQAGHKEIVLTGIHLGGYGADLSPAVSLDDLVKGILALEGEFRLRLSSLDPAEVNRELLETVSGSPKFCPHFHLPLQSGDRTVLARMKRPYTPGEYADKVGEILSLLPGAAVGADVIVGFPGEDGQAFSSTQNLIQGLDLAYLHVFPFSPRQGTAAFKLDGRVDPVLVKERALVLRELGQRKNREFLSRMLGKPMEVLVESRRDPRTGLLTGVSREYVSLVLEGGDELMNKLIKVEGRRVKGAGIMAERVEKNR